MHDRFVCILCVWSPRNIEISIDGHTASARDQTAARFKLAQITIRRASRRTCGPQSKQLAHSFTVNDRPEHTRAQQRVRMIGKRNSARRVSRIEQRQFSHSIAREDHFVPRSIQNARNHRPLQVIGECTPPFSIRLQRNFRICGRAAQPEVLQKRITISQSPDAKRNQIARGSRFRGTKPHPPFRDARCIALFRNCCISIGMVNAKEVHIATLLPCTPPYYAEIVNSMTKTRFSGNCH